MNIVLCRHCMDSEMLNFVYWYVHRNCQQNIALFCAISDFVVLLLLAVSVVSNTAGDPENRFFSGMGTGREVSK